MMEDFSQLVVVYDKASYEVYLDTVSKQIYGDGSPESEMLSSQYSIQFPEPPSMYPCLIATLIEDLDPLDIKHPHLYKVNCCYVYIKDAQSLLAAEAQIEQSIVEDLPGLPGPGVPANVPKDESNEHEGNFPHIAAGQASLDLDRELEDFVPEEVLVSLSFVAGLAKELVEIGALKIDRLEKASKKVYELAAHVELEALSSVPKFIKLIKGITNADK